jgi:hypothetical protein
MGTKKGYLWAIVIWSVGAVLHALCGLFTQGWMGGDYNSTAALVGATGDAAVEKLNGLLEGLSDVEALKGTLTTGSTEEKANAIVKIMNLFSKKN